MSDDTLVRRRDAVEVIGAGRVEGQGHRGGASPGGDDGGGAGVDGARLAAPLRPQRRAGSGLVTVLAHDLHPMLAPLAPTGTPLGDAVEAIAVAARAASLRLAPTAPWRFASTASRGRLLSNTSWPWAPAG